MATLERGQLRGSFTGFRSTDTTFEFSGGGTWKQAAYKYHYHYAYMPYAEVHQEGGRCYLKVQGLSQSFEVRRAS